MVVSGSSFTKAIRCLAPYRISVAIRHILSRISASECKGSDDVFTRVPVCFTTVFVVRDSVFNHELCLFSL